MSITTISNILYTLALILSVIGISTVAYNVGYNTGRKRTLDEQVEKTATKRVHDDFIETQRTAQLKTAKYWKEYKFGVKQKQ